MIALESRRMSLAKEQEEKLPWMMNIKRYNVIEERDERAGREIQEERENDNSKEAGFWKEEMSV
jgi:hypothetical protein